MTCAICDSGAVLNSAIDYQNLACEIVEHHRKLAMEIYKILEFETRQWISVLGVVFPETRQDKAVEAAQDAEQSQIEQVRT